MMLLTRGSDSLRYKAINRKSAAAKLIANIAGNQNQTSVDLSDILENIAPIIGPIMKPSEKAIPTKACYNLFIILLIK